ncbi:MAG: protease [Syntrophomonadaceae bacterium]|nr:protease [Syntrophomonadaceae bacterium]
MQSIYWGCLFGGALFALVTIIFGDVLGDVLGGLLDFLSFDHLDFLSPMVLVGGITVFGGAGIMLERLTSLDVVPVALFSLLIALVLSALVYFVYVKPMKNAENSSGYSMSELVGKIATVIVPVPGQGYGEVLIKVGAGNTNQIAASYDGEDYRSGTRVIVAEIRDGAVLVFGYQED